MIDPGQTPFQSQPSPNIVLAIVSLSLGVIGLFGIIPTLLFTLCGVIPIGFGIGALVVGILAKVRAKNDPKNYGGGGLAVGGIAVGALCIVAPILVILVWMLFMFGIAAISSSGR